MFFCVAGVRALRFLNPPPPIATDHFGLNTDFNCTTDDPDATVSLLHQKQFGSPWIERAVMPNKIVLKGQTFTVLNLIKDDAGNYKCKARDKSGGTIESGMTFFLISSGALMNVWCNYGDNIKIAILSGGYPC